MESLSLDQLNIFAVFAVPGIVAISLYRLLIPSESRPLSSSFPEAVAFSLLNYGIWFWLVAILARPGYQLSHPWLFALGAALILIISPALLAVLYFKVRTARCLGKWVIHPTPTGWDYFFGQGEPCWILIRLKSGDQIGGFFGENSFASSFPYSGDLYIEEVWATDSAGVFLKPIDGSKGAIIRREDCTTIELFRKDA